MKRMLATDLDGTLLAPDASVSDRTLDAIGRAREAGLIVAFVTGRPPRWLAPVVDQLGWHGLAVAANGAVLVDLDKRLVEQTFPMDQQTLREAVARIRSLIPQASFGVERAERGAPIPFGPIEPGSIPAEAGLEEAEESGQDQDSATRAYRLAARTSFGYEPEFGARRARPSGGTVGAIEDLIQRGGAVKLLARGPVGSDPDAVLTEVQHALAGTVTVTHSTRAELLLEMCHRGVNKATGLAWLAATHGVDRANVIAVGDMPNDLPMLQWAGRGYAVGNAHPAVTASTPSARILPTNSQNAVAHLIDELLGHDL